MRIISGTYGKRFIEAPKGLDVRPTTDRVREALFSSLYSLLVSFDNLNILDAFAGTGSLGIEALSRGAKSCVFCERDRHVLKNLEKNLQSLKVPSSSDKILQCDILQNPGAASSQAYFNLIFLDPPYKMGCEKVLELCKFIRETGLVADKNYFIYEHSSTTPYDEIIDTIKNNSFELIKSNKIASTSYEIFSA